MPKRLNNTIFCNQKNNMSNNEECVSSCNKKSNIINNNNINILIVGTLTPATGNGYFYTSKANRIYGYIDAARGTGLKTLKEELAAAKTQQQKNNIIVKINNELNEQNIAFLDIMEKAIRVQGSVADKDIHYYTLDYGAFKPLQNYNGLKVICNSRFAEKGYNKIRENYPGLPKCTFLSQRCGKKDDWLKAL